MVPKEKNRFSNKEFTRINMDRLPAYKNDRMK